MRMRVRKEEKECTDCKIKMSELRNGRNFRWVSMEGFEGYYCENCAGLLRQTGRHRRKKPDSSTYTITPASEQPEFCELCHEPAIISACSAGVRIHQELVCALCGACRELYKKGGSNPIEQTLASRQMKRMREYGGNIDCSQCGAIEAKGISHRHYHRAMKVGDVVCRPCAKHLDKQQSANQG